MPKTDTSLCCDCTDHFCTVCDDSSHCPDCGEPMCEDCRTLADEERMGRCYTCHDPDLSTVQFPGGVRIGDAEAHRWRPRPGSERWNG